jgi:uncharacterized protein YuzE
MAVETLSRKDLNGFLSVLPGLLKIPMHRYSIDYDEDADVLYISFRKPQHATESEMRDDGIIIRKRGKEIVGITILDASKRSA